MRHLLLFLLFLNLGEAIQAQQVSSSCETSDSIRNLYQRDAALLALQGIDQDALSNSFFPDAQLKDSILDALVAVYNAIGLPGREEVISLYNIKINNYQFPEALVLRLDSDLGLTEEFGVDDFLGSLTVLDSLVDHYQLQLVEINESGADYMATLRFTEILHVEALVNEINEIDGVRVVEEVRPEGTGFSEIFYIPHTDFIELRYSFSWDDCPLNCQKEHSWTFKVYPDCKVEFVEEFGDPLMINELEHLLSIGVFPNPTTDLVTVNLLGAPKLDLHIQLFTASGLLLLNEAMPVNSGLINLSVSLKELPKGVYFLAFRNERSQLTEKIVKH